MTRGVSVEGINLWRIEDGNVMKSNAVPKSQCNPTQKPDKQNAKMPVRQDPAVRLLLCKGITRMCPRQAGAQAAK